MTSMFEKSFQTECPLLLKTNELIDVSLFLNLLAIGVRTFFEHLFFFNFLTPHVAVSLDALMTRKQSCEKQQKMVTVATLHRC